VKYFELFIDELGNMNPYDKKSDIYVLSGCAVRTSDREKLKILADQIKYKYWGHTNISFHSRDIGRKEKDFTIFKKNKAKYAEFTTDLFGFLKQAGYTVFVILCDKNKAKKHGWNSVKITRETIHILFYHYITWLLGLSYSKGKITVESATAEKDRYYLSDFSYFLSPGCKELSVGYKKVQTILTSLSFVTKQNSDKEEQVADIFAYAARCKYLRLAKRSTFKIGSYEDRIIRILDSKLFRLPTEAKSEKMKFYGAIEPFCVVPKT
jgi:hypothetical protein